MFAQSSCSSPQECLQPWARPRVQPPGVGRAPRAGGPGAWPAACVRERPGV